MTHDLLIKYLKDKLFHVHSLETACYYYTKKNNQNFDTISFEDISGEVESIALESFKNNYASNESFERIEKCLKANLYKGLNIYHYIGLYLQDKLYNSTIFKIYIDSYFQNHSIKYQYLINKIFNEDFNDKFEKSLKYIIDSTNYISIALKYIYFEEYSDESNLISQFDKHKENLDIIDLLILEDLQEKNATTYDKHQEQLLKDIIWCATEIQSKHKVLNNNEDQYNSNFQSLLKAKGYKTEPQTQRGESYSTTLYGELDIAIFTNNDLPLSIFEAFKIDSIKSDYITMHLKKLSENYDANGLKNNYAVIYSEAKNFEDIWSRYKEFIPKIEFKNPLNSMFSDITHRFATFASIRVGLTNHNNKGNNVQIYHIFMDMNF